MKVENQIIDLQEKLPTKEEALRRSRRIAIVLASFTIVTILAVVYALVQQTEAKRQSEIVLRVMEKTEILNNRLNLVEREALQQREIAEEQKKIAVEALEACKLFQKKIKK